MNHHHAWIIINKYKKGKGMKLLKVTSAIVCAVTSIGVSAQQFQDAASVEFGSFDLTPTLHAGF